MSQSASGSRSLSIFLVAAAMLLPNVSAGQDGDPPPFVIVHKDSATTPLIFPAICCSLMLVAGTALTIGLALAYGAKRITAATAWFIAGGCLLLGAFGLGAAAARQIAIMASSMANGANNVHAPDGAALAREMSASLDLAIFAGGTLIAILLGIAAIIAAFMLKKPVPAPSRLP